MINVLINVLTCKTFEMNEGVLCFSKLYIGFLPLTLCCVSM